MLNKYAKGSAATESTSERLARLRRAMDAAADIDYGEGLPPESKRVQRDAHGRLPRKPRSAVRDAILRELGRREMTRYELWKRARKGCPTLPESAVYEFLRGQRQIGINYIEALLEALHFTIVPISDIRVPRAKAG